MSDVLFLCMLANPPVRTPMIGCTLVISHWPRHSAPTYVPPPFLSDILSGNFEDVLYSIINVANKVLNMSIKKICCFYFELLHSLKPVSLVELELFQIVVHVSGNRLKFKVRQQNVTLGEQHFYFPRLTHPLLHFSFHISQQRLTLKHTVACVNIYKVQPH